MATITSNGTGGGGWLQGATWIGGVAPTLGDQAIIQAGDTVYIDGDVSVGTGTTTSLDWQVDCSGNLVWRNQAGDSAANWTFTIDGAYPLIVQSTGRFFIGTEDSSLFGTESVGPIPATRVANIFFDTQFTHFVYFDNHDTGTSAFEFWGAENYHQAAPDAVSAQTVDSTAANKTSFVDAARTSDAADLWQGAWLEITAGTNAGQKREVTAFDNSTGTISWSANQPMPDPCDDTTVYSLTHNYHRALLTADASAGSDVTITLDRNADWVVGDEIAIAVGADYTQTTERPERVTIKTKISAKQYTVDLVYDHKAGDMVVHLSKNIVFDGDTGGSSRGYNFRFQNSSGAFFKCQWAFFDNCGLTGIDLFECPGQTYFPILKHCTAFGYQVGTANTTSKFALLRVFELPEEYMLEDIHVVNMSGIVDFDNTTRIGFTTLENIERMAFRNFTLIGAVATGVFITTSYENTYPPKFYNIWMTGRPVESSSAQQGTIYQGGVVEIDGFRCAQIELGFFIQCTTTRETITVGTSFVKNGYIHTVDTQGIRCINQFFSNMLIENFSIIRALQEGIRLEGSNCVNLYLINNKYNNCNRALVFITEHPVGRIHEYGGEYGVDTANTLSNIDLYSTVINDEGPFSYISHNTKYVTPSSIVWNDLLINKAVTDSNTGLTYQTRRFRSMGAMSRVELANPTLDGTPYHSMALTHACTFVEVLEHPTDPRATSNIKLKITPYAALGEAHVNLADPFIVEVAQDDVVTVSVWFRKNIAQLVGYSPRLTVLGNGFYKSAQMTASLVDTWEKVSITFTARYSGPLMAWISCYNNLEYAKDNLLGYNGLPAAYGTVVVYADELDISIA